MKKKTNKSSDINSITKQNKLESIVSNIICIMLFVIFGYISIIGFLQTSIIDPENYASEIILYQNDNIAINILFITNAKVHILMHKA